MTNYSSYPNETFTESESEPSSSSTSSSTVNIALQEPDQIHQTDSTLVIKERPWNFPALLSGFGIKNFKKGSDMFSIIIIILLAVVLLYLFTRK